jgi:hypothetical protein
MEWPSLGLGAREMALNYAIRLPRLSIGDGGGHIANRRRQVRLLPSLLSGREPLLEGLVLGLAGSIDEKPAEQPRARSGGRTEPGVPANRASDGPDAGTRSGAGNRALLGWGHIRASNERHSDGRK